jgi:hypothetical protein
MDCARPLSCGQSTEPKIPHPSAVTTNDTRLTLTVNAMDAMSDMPSAERKITVRTKRFHGLAEATIFDAGSQIGEGEAPPTGERFATVHLSASQFAAPIERPQTVSPISLKRWQRRSSK